MIPGAAELDAAVALQDSSLESSLPAHSHDESAQRRVLGRPLVLWDNDPRRGRLVIACCRRAAAAGVRAGMPIAGASELVNQRREQAPSQRSDHASHRTDHASHRSDHDRARESIQNTPSSPHQQQPSLAPKANSFDANKPTRFLPPVVLQHDPWLDQESLQKIATDLQQKITPQVAIETLDEKPWAGRSLHQPQSLLCEVTGITHLFGGEQGLLHATQKCLAKFGCVGRMAIADNAAAAWALAHYATQSRHRSGNESTEWFIAPPETTSQHLEPLSINALRIAPATANTLYRLGVEKISQLMALPRGGLAARLGETLVTRLSQALGEIDVPLQVHRAAAEDIASLELEYPSGDQKILADRVERLIKKVRTGLATRQRGALRITCRLALADLPPLTFEVGLFAPTLDVDHLTRLLVSAIEAKPLPAPVTHITVKVTLSGPLRSTQTALFEKESFTDGDDRDGDWIRNPAAARLIDALSGRLGRDAVTGILVNENPLPEKAVTTFPLTGNSVQQKQNQSRRLRKPRLYPTRSSPTRSMYETGIGFRQKSSMIPKRENPLRRPLILLTKPKTIKEHPIQPSHPVLNTNEIPSAFRCGGKIHRIVRHWGPERIESDWWQGDSIRRDYYRVETDQGHWWWIFRSLGRQTDHEHSSPWMLHGYF
tara:strand:- start:121729 stop:123705 length:1977 start_codon:yes stop_codon:yes gene_type:complete